MKAEEHKLQVSIAKWLDWTQDFPFFAIPNGGLRNIKVAAQLKAEGVKAGVADMFWMISNDKWDGLFVEVKIKGNYQQPSQKEFEALCLKNGYYYAVVRSIEDCEELINQFKTNQI